MTAGFAHVPRNDWQRVGVIAPCGYGRRGLVTLLRSLPHPALRTVTGFAAVHDALFYPHDGQGVPRASRRGRIMPRWDALVIHLPREPQAGLAMLLQLGAPAVSALPLSALIVLSPFPPEEVRRVLQLVRVNHPLQVMDARLGVGALCDTFGAGGQVMMPYVPYAGMAPAHLTKKERQVLLCSLRGISVPEQAYLRALSAKTVYGHKQSAVHKLGAGSLRQLLERFRPGPAGSGNTTEEPE